MILRYRLVLFLFILVTKAAQSQILDIGDTLKLTTITNSLVAYYPFTGNAGDSSGLGNHGTEKNGVSLTTDRFGIANRAYQFDGNNDYIEVPDHSSLDVTDSFTITLWMNQYSAVAGGYRMFDKTSVGTNDGYEFDTYGTGSGRNLRIVGGSNNVSANVTFNLNTWNQVLVKHYKDSSWLYQNGSLIGKGPQKDVLANSLNVRIGTNQNNGNTFNGKIDEIRLYNRALCDLEIKVVYGTILILGAKAVKTNVCYNKSTFIDIINPQPYTQYRLLKASDSSVVGSMQSSPCSDTLRFTTTNLLKTDSFIFRATNPSNSQSIYLDTIIKIFVNPQHTNDTIDTLLCKGSSVIFNGNIRSSPGFYNATFLNSGGCDSIVTLHIIQKVDSFMRTLSICNGDSILLQKSYRKTAGIYYDTIPRTGKCDSVLITTLNIKNTYNTNSSYLLCFKDSVLVNNKYYNATGTYYDTLTSSLGCDSILTINVTLKNDTFNRNLMICIGDSVFLQKAYRKFAGKFYDSIPRTGNCDSVVITNLSLINSFNIYYTYTICATDSVLVNGKYLKNLGLNYDTLTSAGGCDSIITTEIFHRPVKFGSRQETICANDSLKIGSIYYKTSGIYNDTIYRNNCLDSIINVDLTVLAPKFSTANIQICAGDFITINGKPIATAGTYFDSLKTSFGCDSIHAINLTVNPDTLVTYTFKVCEGDSVFIQSIGLYVKSDTALYDSLTSDSGCDSIRLTNVYVGGYPPNLDSIAYYCGDKPIVLDAGIDYVSYLWNTGNNTRYQTASVDGQYSVFVTDTFNCQYTDTIKVVERCGPVIFAPSSFTPNGDGLNDYLILNAQGVDFIIFKVYDRWGEIVFETEDPNAIWTGTFKDKALITGVYFWHTSYGGKNADGKIIKKNESGLLHIIY